MTIETSSVPEASSAFLDPTKPISERVEDLVSRLTLEEKISQMLNACPGIPRLGIPAYDYWSEAQHGIARNGRATVFPQTIGMAATWDRDLIFRVANAISDEGRAKYHETLRRKGYTRVYQGLSFCTPNINLFRDPRWGRGQESWGEDPFLIGELAASFVKGMQGDNPIYLKTVACAKHYAVHSGPEKLRHSFNAKVSLRDLYSTYLPAFKKLVTEAKVQTVMGAYNRTNDEACCASQLLLNKILRQEWGFTGHVTADCTALTDIHQNHKLTKDAAESAALALKAGCDISCWCTYDHLGESIERGLITEKDIDRSLSRTLTTRFKLGIFDPQEMVPYSSTPMSVVGCKEHRDLAYLTAAESVVLLKNKNNLLPLSDKIQSMLVVGPNAGSIEVLIGNYFGMNSSMSTFVEGIAGRLPEGVAMEFMPGCMLAHPKRVENDYSLLFAGSVDVIIAFVGLSPLLEGEEGEAILSDNGDRKDIRLPENQVNYLRKLASTGSKIVLVLSGGSAIALDGLEEIIDAIVFVWYPGQEGGRAVANVLFGDHSPSGKLPVTFPKSIDQLPPFEDYDMAGRTYRFSREEPLFPFGFGLSYTTFQYSELTLDRYSIKAGQSVQACLTLTNTGNVDADEVVQFYLSDLDASVPVPLYNLIGFERISLKAGESKKVCFVVIPEMMMLFDEEGKQYLEPGCFRLTIGGSSPSDRSIELGCSIPVIAQFNVE